MMNTQFTKSFNAFEEAGFKPVAVSILNHLYDYGDLSMKNGWIKNKVVFVKYLRSTLAEQINVSVDTITRALKDIEAKGWLKIQHVKNAANTYYLTKYNDLKSGTTKQNASTGNAKCNTNHTNFKHTNNKHKDTNVTVNDKNSNKKMVNESVDAKDNIVIDNPKSKTIHFDDNDAKQNILNGVKAKVDGCSKPFINTMVKYTNDHTELDKLFGIIFKSKNNAKKSLSSKFKHAEDALTFEKNEYLMPELDRTMNQLFLKVNVNKGIKSKFGYIYNSLVKFFKQRVYDYVGTVNYYSNSDFNIPIIKLDE